MDTARLSTFWKRVDRAGDCWVWIAGKNPSGYGQFAIGGRTRPAHRIAYELTNGPVPDGMHLDHRCHNPACVNPGHLRIVTRSQNLQHRTGSNANSKSGHRGVFWDKERRKWEVQARVNGKKHHGGRFDNLDEAVTAVRALRDRLMTHHDPTFG